MKKTKELNKGITLIALVITIIVILILAVVSINAFMGDDGLLKRTAEGKEDSDIAQEKEEIKLAIGASLIDKNGIITDESLRNEITQSKNLNVNNLSGNDPWLYHGKKTYTIDRNGRMIEGIYSVWDGESEEVPEIRKEENKFNWYIYNCAQLKFFEEFVNNANKLTENQKELIRGVYNEEDIVLNEETNVQLMSNLDFGAREKDGTWNNEENRQREWTPIGKTKDYKLIAKFDGNHYTVNGIYINLESKGVGLFGYAYDVENLIIQNSHIEGRIRTGSIAGYSEKLYDCHNINTEVILKEGAFHTVGGVVGYFNGELLSKCTNNGRVIAYGISASNNSQAGGVVGYLTNVASIEDCKNYGEVNAVGNRVGGIAGQNNSKFVKKCSNYGKVSSDKLYTGGICGMSYNGNLIENCENFGIVESKDRYAGGITGSADGTNSMEITNCKNNGDITGGSTVGGIAGYQNGTVTISKCENTGNIRSGEGAPDVTSNGAGGIAGSGYAAINESINRGEVISYKSHRWNRAGGIAGFYRIKS